MDNIWLSIIVAAYNVEDYIVEALYSALDQVDERVELVVVNDGSKDATSVEIEKVVKAHPRGGQLRILNQDNQGLSEARNNGLQLAQGQYIAFLDGDDVLLPSFYTKVVEAISRSPCEPDIVEFNAVRFSCYSQGECQDATPFGVNLIGDYSGQVNEEILEQIFSHAYWFAWARLYKKELFNGLSFPAGCSYEDMMLTPQLYLRAKCLAGIADPLIGYRINLGSITKNPSSKDLRDIEAVIDRYLRMSTVESNQFYRKLLLLVACQGALFYKSISNDMKGYFRSISDIGRVVKKVNNYKKGVEMEVPFNTRMLFLSPFFSNLYSYFKQLL